MCPETVASRELPPSYGSFPYVFKILTLLVLRGLLCVSSHYKVPY